jgi:hypothetical protein
MNMAHLNYLVHLKPSRKVASWFRLRNIGSPGRIARGCAAVAGAPASKPARRRLVEPACFLSAVRIGGDERSVV